MKPFMDNDFLLHNEPAKVLYHSYAKDQPIIDYHNHLPPDLIAQNYQFKDLGELWLAGDHYKWRAMRAAGIPEELITGTGTSNKEKFLAWAKVVPQTIGNPLYHWTHLELRRYFGITDLLSPSTAEKVWDQAAAKIAAGGFTTRGLLESMNVVATCSTDDPADTLEHHDSYKKNSSSFVLLPAFRPDKAMQVSDPQVWNQYIQKLSKAAGMDITSYQTLIQALDQRHQFFASKGCKLSDHGIQRPVFEPATAAELKTIVETLLANNPVTDKQAEQLQTAVLLEVGRMNHARGFTMQLHIGAIRNNSSRAFRTLGPDTGYDSIADEPMATKLSKFLDGLDTSNQLPKMIVYNLNPRDNYLVATMVGNFQGGGIPGKLQFGSGWWFLDQKEAMEWQMNALANLGLLSRFVGMLTDSRSFLSFPRHEYFRRILCNLLGTWVDQGQAPWDEELLGSMVVDICYRNARDYFGFDLAK